MASATIPNSAGPGSSIQLSDVTIAVRDKVIEKFADESLEKMNESVKMLLNNLGMIYPRLVENTKAADIVKMRKMPRKKERPKQNQSVKRSAVRKRAKPQ